MPPSTKRKKNGAETRDCPPLVQEARRRALKVGLIGKHPSLTKLERGDIVHQTDFRSVYATLLDQ